MAVYVNDGRQHLQMQPPALVRSDHAGAAADWLCRRGRPVFARSSTRWRGRASSRAAIVSQWLPAYQVPAATTLAMIRAFIDVFPQAVLISGAEADLLLLGANDSRIEIDPVRVAAALSRGAGGCRRTCSGSISGACARSSARSSARRRTLRRGDPGRRRRSATIGRSRNTACASLLDFGEAVPASIVDLPAGRRLVPGVLRRRQAGAAGGRARHVPGAARSCLRGVAARRWRVHAAWPDSTAVSSRAARISAPSFPNQPTAQHPRHRARAAAAGSTKRSRSFARRSGWIPGSAQTHWHLGAALAYARCARRGGRASAPSPCELDPDNADGPARSGRPCSRLTRVVERP